METTFRGPDPINHQPDLFSDRTVRYCGIRDRVNYYVEFGYRKENGGVAYRGRTFEREDDAREAFALAVAALETPLTRSSSVFSVIVMRRINGKAVGALLEKWGRQWNDC